MNETIKFNIKLETNGKEVMHKLSMDTEDLIDAVKEVTKQSEKFSTSMQKIASKGFVLTALKEAFEEVNSVVGSLASEFNTFDKAMRSVNTMAGVGREELKGLKSEIEELGATIPLAKDALASGLYQVISNGVPRDNWISFLQRSAKASVGGMADLGQTVTVTSTIIKNYGAAWDDAGSIQDKIQMTAKNGVTSFEQLAAALPRVTGNAATLGVSIDELLATFATLTGVSGNTAEVSTQLAAVFTALVKPSSEAAEMAEEMGIRFDAAAIMAAGGMQNFLSQLTADVSQYASVHGMLEQEIYGRLFGSAEALRALIPLTGELADTFSTNVSAMAQSSGTIDAAFNDMAGSGEALQQTLRNQISTFTDWAGSVASSVQPYMQCIALLGQMCASFGILKTTISHVKNHLLDIISTSKTFGNSLSISTIHIKIQAAAQRLLAASSWTATAGVKALRIATAALYATLTLGISAIITGLISLFSSLGDSAEESSEKIDHLKDASEQFTTNVAETRAAIDMEIASLRSLIAASADESQKVEELNRKYGDAMGHHASAAEWYETLISKSRAYCDQIGYEAQARLLASRKAEAQLKLDSMRERKAYLDSTVEVDMGRSRGRKRTMKMTRMVAEGVSGKEYAALGSDIAAAEKEVAALGKTFDACIVKMQTATAELSKGVKKANDIKPKTTPQKTPTDSPSSTAETASTKENKSSESSAPEYRPGAIQELDTLEELRQAIAYYQELQATGSADEIADLQRTIDLLESKRDALTALTTIPSMQREMTELGGLAQETLKLRLEAIGIEEVRQKIASLQAMLSNTTTPLSDADAESVNKLLTAWQDYEKTISDTTNAQEENNAAQKALAQKGNNTLSLLGNMGSMMSTLSGVVKGGAAGWLQYSANILGAVAQALPALASVIGGNIAQAFSGAAAQSQTVPFPFNLVALAASMTAVGAAVASIPKFATGAIAYGPTLGLFGEYVGASSNPEVVAPLDRLRELIAPQADAAPMGGKVEFAIRGRRLFGILEKEQKIRARR